MAIIKAVIPDEDFEDMLYWINAFNRPFDVDDDEVLSIDEFVELAIANETARLSDAIVEAIKSVLNE